MRKYLTILLLSLFIVSCNEGQDNDVKENTSTKKVDETIVKERANKASQMFHTVPSPLETASIFENAGAEYNGEILNDIKNVSKYSTNYKKAINFGVYGADLSYANIYDQSQESMFYMNCAKKLADGLGITSAFDAETMERIEENVNNRDSLMKIINDAYWIADGYLKENEQQNLSALIISGGWIEGLYLGAKSLNKKNPDKVLYGKIADQKYSLNDLIALMQTYDNEDIKNISNQLLDLKKSFDKITEDRNETTLTNDKENNETVIGGGNTLNFDNATIFEISDKIEKIRNGIIQ